MRPYPHNSQANGVSSLTEQVFSILDSRIQFIDFQVQRYFNHCTSGFSKSSKDEFTYSGPSEMLNLVNNFDQMLSYTEELQRDLKRLQTLKAWLKEETVQCILDLLTNNKYLTISDEKLEYLLRQKALPHYQA